MRFRPTLRAQGLALLLMNTGCLLPLFLGYSWYQSGEPPLLFVLFVSLVCAMFVFGGFVMKQQVTTLTCFDRSTGHVDLGPLLTDAGTVEGPVHIEQIHALQLLSKQRVKSMQSVGTYQSFELNLVLRNGSRVHVIDHGDGPRLRQDAQALSRFLSRPLWDTTSTL